MLTTAGRSIHADVDGAGCTCQSSVERAESGVEREFVCNSLFAQVGFSAAIRLIRRLISGEIWGRPTGLDFQRQSGGRQFGASQVECPVLRSLTHYANRRSELA
jgi:hypothetical protein